MTLDEALAELGLDAGASPDEARRAYLRLLKKRKPEVDPQGFMRLREAYEAVKTHLDWMERLFPRAAAEEAAPRAEPGVVVAAPQSEVAAPAAPNPDPPPVEREEETSKEELSARDLSPGTGDEPPGTGEASPGTREEPPGTGDEPSGTEDEPPGTSASPPGTEDEPPRTSEEAAAASGEEDDDTSASAVEAAIAMGLPEYAAHAAAKLYRRAARRVEEPGLSPRVVIDLIATLHERGVVEIAEELREAFAGWLVITGREARVLRGDLAARWTLVRELSALSPSFPREARAAIARGVIEGDLSVAAGRLRDLFRDKPKSAKRAAAELREKAPLIAAELAAVIEPKRASLPPEVAPPEQRSSSGRAAWIVVMVAVALIRLISMGSRSSSTPQFNYKFPTYPTPTVDFSKLYGFDGGLPMFPFIEERRQQALSRARELLADDAGARPDARDVNKLISALERRNCAGARAAMTTLKNKAKKADAAPGGSALGSKLLFLGQDVDFYCTSIATFGARTDTDTGAGAETGADTDADAGTQADAGAGADAGKVRPAKVRGVDAGREGVRGR